MKLKRPIIGAGLVVLSLAAASVASVRFAVADDAVGNVNSKLYEANKTRLATGAMLDDAGWKSLEAEAKLASRLAPDNGFYWNALARVYYQPRTTDGAAVSPDYLAAYQASRAAVVAQPSSGYAWSGLAYAADHLFAQNQLPGGKAALEQAISQTFALGPREPQLLGAVVDLGMANWPVLEATTRQDVLRAVKELGLRHPGDVLAIATNRGRLAVVCAEPVLTKQQVCAKKLKAT